MNDRNHEEALENEKTKKLFYEIVKQRPIDEFKKKGKNYCEECGKLRVLMKFAHKNLCSECSRNELMEIDSKGEKRKK